MKQLLFFALLFVHHKIKRTDNQLKQYHWFIYSEPEKASEGYLHLFRQDFYKDGLNL